MQSTDSPPAPSKKTIQSHERNVRKRNKTREGGGCLLSGTLDEEDTLKLATISAHLKGNEKKYSRIDAIRYSLQRTALEIETGKSDSESAK